MRNENTDLTAIVARLERQLRTVKLTLGIVLLGIAGMALTAWVSPQGDTLRTASLGACSACWPTRRRLG